MPIAITPDQLAPQRPVGEAEAGRIAALHDRVRSWAAERALLNQPDLRRALARAAAVMHRPG